MAFFLYNVNQAFDYNQFKGDWSIWDLEILYIFEKIQFFNLRFLVILVCTYAYTHNLSLMAFAIKNIIIKILFDIFSDLSRKKYV